MVLAHMHWDRDSALSRVGNDIDLLKEIAQLFLDDAGNMMSSIEQAAKQADAVALGKAAHTLKGCVSNFSAPEAYEAALHLERLGRTGDLSGVAEGLSQLRQKLDDLCAELRSLIAE